MTAPIIGCGNEPTPEPEYTSDGTTSGSACAVAFPTGFYCDANSEAGAKHTPVISAMSNNDDSYSMTVSVPHVVNADHHILGCQVVGYIPGAVNPHVWLDFHYYTNDYIIERMTLNGHTILRSLKPALIVRQPISWFSQSAISTEITVNPLSFDRA